MSSDKRARAGACKVCRIRKRKCHPGALGPFGPCQMCAELSVPCSLVLYTGENFPPASLSTSESNLDEASATNLNNSNGPVFSPSPGTALDTLSILATSPRSPETYILPPLIPLREIVDLYFRLIHNGPHTLFHEPSFINELESNVLSPILLLAVIAVSARFSKNSYFSNIDPRVRGHSYAESAMGLLQQEMTRPSLVTIQAFIIMSQYLGGNGDVNSKHIYIGLARLHSQTIRLWEMPVNSTMIMREVRRRTWLSVSIADKWSAADMSTSSVMADDQGVFPIFDEVEFVSLRSGVNEVSVQFQASGNGLWTQISKMTEIFRNISDMIMGLCSGRRSVLSQEENIASLEVQLERWLNQLPAPLEFSRQNLAPFSSVGFGKTFLIMHICYHHFRQLLYYPFLDHRVRSSHHSKSRYPDLCKEHARFVSDIGRLAFQNKGCELLAYIVGHILVVSSSVHLHTLLFSERVEEADQARGDLISNFEILMQLKMYWPVIDLCVGRLRTFQNECRSSMSDSFMLDGWMLKFLMTHSAVLDSERWSVRGGQMISDQSLLPKNLDAWGNGDEIGTGSLMALVSDQNLSNDALVENALSWLLD